MGAALVDIACDHVSLFQHKLAEVKTSIAVARAFIDQCMELHEVDNAQSNLAKLISEEKEKHNKLDTTQVGKCGNELASMAKYWTTELENKVAADCLQLHGGWGFMWETNIAKAYASARIQVGQMWQT